MATLKNETKFRTKLSTTGKKNIFFFIAFSSLFLLFFTSAFAASPTKPNRSSKKVVAQAPSFVPNRVENPGFTMGPKCDFNVELLIDRSGSILSNAVPAGSQTDANSIKSTVNSFLDSLASHANATGLGSNANVYTDAFATYSIPQNGAAPEPWMGLTGEDAFYSINITDTNRHENPRYPIEYRGKTNLEYQKYVVDNIWYPNSPGRNPYDPTRPNSAYKGYLGGDKFAPNRNTGLGGTNWEDALNQSANRIRFWTGSDDPNFANDDPLKKDKDFDLVIMITDGVPTLNNGPDNIATPGETSLNTADVVNDDDVMHARNAVNALRTGRAIVNSDGSTVVQSRPKTNVIGIMAGGYSRDASASTYLTSVFGEEDSATVGKNWYLANNFTDGLGGALQNAIDELGCVPHRVVHPSVQITATPAVGEIEEGGSRVVNVTVENTGDVPLRNIEVRYNGSVIGTSAAALNPGLTLTGMFSQRIDVAMGAPSPVIGTFEVTAEAVLEASDVCEPGVELMRPSASDDETSCANPHDETSVNFSVKRKTLPS